MQVERKEQMRMLVVIALLILPVFASAEPYLVCEPVPWGKDQPTEYSISFDDGPWISVPAVKADPNCKEKCAVQFKYDLKGSSFKNVKMRAVNASGMSDAVSYTKMSPPQNVRRVE